MMFTEVRAKPPPIRSSKLSIPVGQTLWRPFVENSRPEEAMINLKILANLFEKLKSTFLKP